MPAVENEKAVSEDDLLVTQEKSEAAIKIQAAYKGYLTRKNLASAYLNHLHDAPLLRNISRIMHSVCMSCSTSNNGSTTLILDIKTQTSYSCYIGFLIILYTYH